MKVLMVCLGNICRSPMAEGILRSLALEKNLDIVVDSCGTSAWHINEQPDSRAQKTMKDKGIDISSLRGRQFSTEDFDTFDIIFTMDDSNHNDILALATSEEQKKKVRMLLNETFPNENMPVPDPYFGGDQGFEEVFNLLNNACTKFLDTTYGN